VSTLNLGIVAHVDAGKTSLTERLLFAAGVIDTIGRVDDGSTQTDTLALERQRGITIRSAVVSFAVDDLTVNLIDTPGHPDFIAEVERTLTVLDGAVLVISAVEGVQAQTRVLMRALRRLGLPTLIFVNKIDRAGARGEQLLAEIRQKLTSDIVPMGSVRELGTRQAAFEPWGAADAAFTTQVAEVIADHDEEFLAAYLDGGAAISHRRLQAGLAACTRAGHVHPVFSGSAITGAGVDALASGLRDLLPTAGDEAGGSAYLLQGLPSSGAQSKRRALGYRWPPSTTTFEPVTHEARGDSRKAITSPTSRSRPSRPNGNWVARNVAKSSGFCCRNVSQDPPGNMMEPGLTAFTRM